MPSKPKHARRLSLFGLGLGTSQPLSSGERTPRPSTNAASIAFSFSAVVRRTDEKDVPCTATTTPITRRLSKKRKPNQKPLPRPPSPPPSSYSFSNAQLSEPNHESDKSSSIQRQPSLKRKSSLNFRAALSSIFVSKPSRKRVTGILDGMEGISSGKVDEVRREGGRKPHCYESRSPSPPSPEIRPPSGLGQIVSSVDLSTYLRDEYEGSLLASISRSVSRTPSVALSISTPRSEVATATASSATSRTKSLKSCESNGEFFYKPLSRPRTAPSQKLIKALELTLPYCSSCSISSLARTSHEFLHSARVALYANIDSDDLQEDEKRRRRMLETLASNSVVGNIVKGLRWVCLNGAASPTSCSVTPRRSIPRRAPAVSISSLPEEYILLRVLSLVPNLETLNLLQPHSSVLRSFLPIRQTPWRSPSASPVCAAPQLPSPALSSLTSLTLSGRTTLSTTFGSMLVRFLELHPGIRELNLPDVFCLPNVNSLSRHSSGSSSSSSTPISTTTHEVIPPVPPLPPSYASMKDKELHPLPMLPNLTRLTAPLTLATQLVPGRPLRTVDIELATSLYEGLRPAEVARVLADTRVVLSKDGNVDVKDISWKAARQARRAGTGVAKRAPSVRELRLRCTAKVDGRTIGRVLNALGKELGMCLEMLAIGWSGLEPDLHAQLTPTLARFHVLQRLEIFQTSNGVGDSEDCVSAPAQKSVARLQAGIALERNLVEQWSHMCPRLSYVEFASQRVWKAR